MINQKTDDLDNLGYINKKTILEYVSQEDIFALVFGFEPVEFEYITSPFRGDNSPGCWFEYYDNGMLRFKDFGTSASYRRIKLSNIDCFDAVQVHFKLPNFYETLNFIKSRLIDGIIDQKIVKSKDGEQIKVVKRLKKNSVKLFVSTRDWEKRDAIFWSRYEISKANLIEDKVFPIKKLKMKHSKKGDFTFIITDRGYAYTEFRNSKKKVYRPYQKNKRFITNCGKNDIGGINSLVPFGRQLVITKSYKDWRVLKNQGLNVVWFQNEGMIPDPEYLLPLVKRFDSVIVFFDNDNAGLEAAKNVSNTINNHFPGKSRPLNLPVELANKKISDPSDLIYRKGRQVLLNFLKEKQLIL